MNIAKKEEEGERLLNIIKIHPMLQQCQILMKINAKSFSVFIYFLTYENDLINNASCKE